MSRASVEDRRSIAIMHREIATIPGVIADQTAALRGPLRELAREVGPSLEEIVFTGCGDSHFAGIATRLAFERFAGIRCRASEALELARYEMRYVPREPPPLLVAISYSGEVGRTIDAVRAAGSFGWRTVALTGRADGRLAREAATSVLMDVPTLGFSPGTSTYVAMVTGLLVLAAELARARGRTNEADAVDRGLELAPSLADQTLAACDEPARAAAELVAAETTTTFLGAGPSRASALFGAAKLFEGPQRYGVAQDLEEWAHEQYFVSGPATPVVVVAPQGVSVGRASELLDEMAFIGAPAIVVSDLGEELLPGRMRLPVARGLDEPLSAIITCLPLAQLAFFAADLLEKRSYGFPSEAHEREHYETIHRESGGEPA